MPAAKRGNGKTQIKQTAKKSAQSKTTSAQSNKRVTKAEQQEKSSRQLWAVLLFVLGLLLLALTIVDGPAVWGGIRQIMYGLFGVSTFMLPLSILFLAIMTTLDRPLGSIKHKVWQSGVLVALVCALIQIFMIGEPQGENFIDTLVRIYQNGTIYKGGGLAGALIGWPLTAACGTLGAKIIIILLVFLFVMLLTGGTLIGLFRTISKPAKKIGESYNERVERREAARRARFDIDIDLGPDPPMPAHPVSSRKQAFDIMKESHEDEPEMSQTPSSELIDTPKDLPIEELVEKAVGEVETNKPAKVREKPAGDVPPAIDSNDQTKLYTDKEGPPPYIYPPVSLLKAPKNLSNLDVSEELKSNAALLVDTLKSFGVQTRIIDISRGPTVTRYELQPSAGVKISKITNLADDIALNLASAGVRIEAPIPNKAAVGIEVPNKNNGIVTIREIVESTSFESAKSKLSVALGRDIAGNVTLADIGKMPHILIAGATGSGKSVCINSIIISLMYKSSPDEVRFLMIDPKVVELGIYNGIPHLLVPVVTDPRKAAGALGWAVTEMLNRYKLFADNGVRDLTGYNALAKEGGELNPLPQIVIIIDELADLMMAAPNEVEDAICRLAQMARAAGMHLVIATQRPSVDVITGVIKANIPSRIAFAVSSQVDSRTILDGGGAEKLLGRGDMLFYPVGMPKPMRVQGCFVSDKEVERVVDFVKNKQTADYDDQIIEEIEKQAAAEPKAKNKDEGGGFSDEDEMLSPAVEAVIEAGQASTSFLQRKLKLGYARAARLIDEMEERGIVGPYEGSKPRQVLISRQQWIERNLNQPDEE